MLCWKKTHLFLIYLIKSNEILPLKRSVQTMSLTTLLVFVCPKCILCVGSLMSSLEVNYIYFINTLPSFFLQELSCASKLMVIPHAWLLAVVCESRADVLWENTNYIKCSCKACPFKQVSEKEMNNLQFIDGCSRNSKLKTFYWVSLHIHNIKFLLVRAPEIHLQMNTNTLSICLTKFPMSKIQHEGSVCNHARCLLKPDLAFSAYKVFFPLHSSPSLNQGTLISGYLLCVGRGCDSQQRRPEVWWKLGSYSGDLSPLVSWRWLFRAVCVWTINLHQASA